ncbi:Hypothetical protein DEACI_2694 [Acididesulfobacillus acetoxydans]|uniref:Uncharacterized protein n=1 Tax=Acididesulfobacillus acetoxydans TaxID=1561005 RepID=A0A8S0VXL3_9FIRM|nr:hypothetical protein [Acididesulfobacillus acetoxydans]CAA7602023.1 Hypothetical protein DEACI_2694 [Acididesulfobacillus acetoxydans]CEJ08134.1 Hypothetical protein DEACI_2609 [Acididesulfobacillus acetoxydans]
MEEEKGRSEGEKKNLSMLLKGQGYKGLSLSPKKLGEIVVRPKVRNGKVLLDKNNRDHRYIMNEGESFS